MLAHDATQHPAPVGAPICIYVDLLTGYGRWMVFLRGIGAFFTGRSPLLRNALPRLGEGRTGIAPAKGEVNLLVLVDLDVDGFQASVGLFDTERDNVALRSNIEIHRT